MNTNSNSAALDTAIIGGGPAALTAAIYLARAGHSVEVFEKANFGGALPLISELKNYPGFVGEGQDLAQRMVEQTRQTGAKVSYGECTDIAKTDSGFELTIDDAKVKARTVIIASGSMPRELDFTTDTPVSYCALCDGALIQGKRIIVIGGANSAVQEAIYLANLAEKVTLVTHSAFKADAQLLANLSALDNVELLESIEPTAELINQYDYCFVYIGRAPASKFLRNLAKDYKLLDKDGYIIVSSNSYQTAIPGLFAAGDVRQGATKQIVTATADGAMAAIELSKTL